MGLPVGEGFRFDVLGDHDADAEDLVAQVQAVAESEVGVRSDADIIELAVHDDRLGPTSG